MPEGYLLGVGGGRNLTGTGNWVQDPKEQAVAGEVVLSPRGAPQVPAPGRFRTAWGHGPLCAAGPVATTDVALSPRLPDFPPAAHPTSLHPSAKETPLPLRVTAQCT